MSRWTRLAELTGRAGVCALCLAPAACSLGDFDSLGAGLDENVGGAGAGGSAGSSGGTAGAGGSGGNAGSGNAGGGDAGSGGAGGSAGAPDGNLIPDGDFDSGSSSWTCFGMCTTLLSEDDPRSGTRCLLTSNRTQVWEGPSLNLIGKVTAGETYRLSVWVRAELDDDPDASLPDTFSIGITQKRSCISSDPPDGTFTQLSSGTASRAWSEQTAVFLAPDCADLQESAVYLERAPAGASFCIDDTSLVLVP
jgi:hypothetical protein